MENLSFSKFDPGNHPELQRFHAAEGSPQKRNAATANLDHSIATKARLLASMQVKFGNNYFLDVNSHIPS